MLVLSPLLWGEGGSLPAHSSAGAGRVRGHFPRISTPVLFSRASTRAIQLQRVGQGERRSNSEFWINHPLRSIPPELTSSLAAGLHHGAAGPLPIQLEVSLRKMVG
jgi:hypothetical protein